MMRIVSSLAGAFVAAAIAVIPSSTVAAPPPQSVKTGHVRVDEYSLSVDCAGGHHGRPTVILLSGFGDAHSIWQHIQPRLAHRTHVCSYDRPGEGASSSPHGTQTLASNARLLHDLLTRLHVHRRVVLVGHSIGGDIAVKFARSYPDQTAGVVVLDATPPGYLQFVLDLIPPSATGLPGALRQEAVSITTGENKEQLKVAGSQWAPTGSLGDTPVDVVQHGQDIFAPTGQYDEPLRTHWEDGQLALAGLSDRSQLITATRSGHYMFVDQPQLALDVINAVVNAASR
ncbi:MAG: alpha/beta fold hydrolase [Nocardioidaceae bacterium]